MNRIEFFSKKMKIALPGVIVQEPAFNQVVETKRFEGVFLGRKDYADFKNQTLKKIGLYTKMLFATEYPGGMQFLRGYATSQISTEMGYPIPNNLI